MEQNQQVLATAYKKAKYKLSRIAELKITPDMDEDDIDDIVMNLATAKAIQEERPVKEFTRGQQWYVESLVKFSGMTPLERLDTEYEDCFADSSSKEDMLAKLV